MHRDPFLSCPACAPACLALLAVALLVIAIAGALACLARVAGAALAPLGDCLPHDGLASPPAPAPASIEHPAYGPVDLRHGLGGPIFLSREGFDRWVADGRPRVDAPA